MTRAILLATSASLLLASAAPAAAPPYDTPAPIAYLIDLSSR
jgi:D-alanyl-D-alanine carboxypeptidase (penicillin-binding protein 5/6)